jgi:predicted transcriptional regulator of viral defense system
LLPPSAIAIAESRTRRTRLASALLERLIDAQAPLVSAYDLFHLLRRLMAQPDTRRLARGASLDKALLRRVINNLVATRALSPDDDYQNRALYRILDLPPGSADDIVCLASPIGYISHLSAMQGWALTDRRPAALHLTMPKPALAREMMAELMARDYGEPFENLPPNIALKLPALQHPARVRGRPVSVHETGFPGQWVRLRSSWRRMATVGQTFLDTVTHPQLCGGMAHVLDIWSTHAQTYLVDITESVEASNSGIAKVRAGYIIDEVLQAGRDPRVQGWARHAQRGGSRVLDPAKPFAPSFSEKWMLSLNV